MKYYTVKYPRTRDWYKKDWPDLVEWCDTAFGHGKWGWDHVTPAFVFNKESDKMLFMLRWI